MGGLGFAVSARLLVLCVLTLLFQGANAFAQSPYDFMRVFGGIIQQGMVQAADSQWRKLPPPEVSCIDQALQRQGASIHALIMRGISPSDARLARFRSACSVQIAQTPEPQSQTPVQASPYVVDGLALGTRFTPDNPAYQRYQCGPSGKFPGFTWCHEEHLTRQNRHEVTRSHSILKDQSGSAWYVNSYLEPAFFGPTDIQNEIDRLSRRLGQRPHEFRLTHRDGLPDAVIAVWGKVELQRLDAADVSTVASGGTVKGLLISYLGDLERSAKADVPVYRLAGGAGFAWAATYNHDGRGQLRFLAIDESRIEPQPEIAKDQSKNQALSQTKPPAPQSPQPTDQLPTQSSEAGFLGLERLVAIPRACAVARRIGPKHLYVRDPFTGHSAPGPFCAAAIECLVRLTQRVPVLDNYLRQHQGLMTKLQLPPAIYTTLGQTERMASLPPNVNCNYASMSVNNLFSLNPGYNSQSAFERVSVAAENLLNGLRSDYKADLTNYTAWLPFAKHYDHSAELAEIEAKYKDAYESADVDGFLQLKPEFQDQFSDAEAFRDKLTAQTDQLALLDSQFTDLSHQAHDEKIATLLDPKVGKTVETLKDQISRLRGIAPADRGDVSDNIEDITHHEIEIKKQIAVARETDEARHHGFSSAEGYENCLTERQRLQASGIKKSCDR